MRDGLTPGGLRVLPDVVTASACEPTHSVHRQENDADAGSVIAERHDGAPW